MLRSSLLFLFSFFLCAGLFAQEENRDTLTVSAFRKGRNYVGIAGSVSSSSLNGLQNIGSQDKYGNVYQLGIRLGRFVGNKHLLGITFDTERTHDLGYIEIEAEVLNAGPWYRIYLGKLPEISFYLHTAVQYSSYIGFSTGLRSFTAIDESFEAIGINMMLGLGVVYVISDRISFEVGVDFTEGNYWGEITDNLTNEVEDINAGLSEFKFAFGFAVLFGKIKER